MKVCRVWNCISYNVLNKKYIFQGHPWISLSGSNSGVLLRIAPAFYVQYLTVHCTFTC